MSESLLIQRAAHGDPLAVRALYERHAARLYAVVRRLTGDDDLAHDASQEAWVRVFRSLSDFRGEARFSTWIHRIAVNSALQCLRQQTRRRDREEELPTTLAGDPVPGDPLLARRLESALEALPPGMREVLVLHDVEGYTHEEIGEVMEIAPGTSKSQLFKARARMRMLLETLPGSEPGLEAAGGGA